MIRIIHKILVRSFDADDTNAWTELPMVPASGTAETTIEKETAGRRGNLNISAVITYPCPILGYRTGVRLVYCDKSVENYGTEDLPVYWTVTKGNSIQISAEYEFAAG